MTDPATLEPARRLIATGRSGRSVASELGIASTTLHRWLSGGIPSPDGRCWVCRGRSPDRTVASNESRDILALMGATLDRVGVAWRYNRPNCLSIARRAAVALVDEHAGPKR